MFLHAMQIYNELKQGNLPIMARGDQLITSLELTSHQSSLTITNSTHIIRCASMLALC